MTLRRGIASGFALVTLLSGCATAPPVGIWIDLFDGRTLAGFVATDFSGNGSIGVENGALVLAPGTPFTGVNYTGNLPASSFEVELRGARLAGDDFFCCLTVPVGASHCSLVVGGWGGRLIGISSLDDMDASENETTSFQEFETGRYYDIRLRVADQRIQAWIDGKPVVDVSLADHQVSVRWEVEPSRPFGIATYETRAGFTRVRYRALR